MTDRYLYLISEERHDLGPCKVGISTNPNRRLAALQTAYPYKLKIYAMQKIPDTRKAERIVHHILGKTRTRGGKEWFDVPIWKAKEVVRFCISQDRMPNEKNRKEYWSEIKARRIHLGVD